MAEMVVVSVFTFERISVFKFLHNPSHSLSPLGTDHHSHFLTFSWALRGVIDKIYAENLELYLLGDLN